MKIPEWRTDAVGFHDPVEIVAGTRLAYDNPAKPEENLDGVVLSVDGNLATVQWDRDGEIEVFEFEEIESLVVLAPEDPGLSDDD